MNLTRKQLFDAVTQHDYIAVRHSDNDVVGVNCKVARRLSSKRVEINGIETNIVSFYPISFNEYIRIKVPFFIRS